MATDVQDFVGGEARPFDPALTRGRTPVVGYGSNQSPEQLRRELQKAADAGLVYDPKAASRPPDEPDEPDEVGEDDDEYVEEYYYDEGEGEPGPK